MKMTRIEDNITELKISNKQNQFLINQLKFFGAKPERVSKTFTYFRFNGNFADCRKYLGIG